MAKKRDLLTQMHDNPVANWVIDDIKKLCREVGTHIEPPNGGSHYKVHSEFIEGHLTVPARRPIKPVYIRSLVALCKAHIEVSAKEKKGK